MAKVTSEHGDSSPGDPRYCPFTLIGTAYTPVRAVMNSVLPSLPPNVMLAGFSGTAMVSIFCPVASNTTTPPPPVRLRDPGRRIPHEEMLRLWEDMPPDVLILDHSTRWPLRYIPASVHARPPAA